ncbi:MAG TPA: methyltransferase domain-containing protein [Candidatus Omnitrophota bacterium]|nr:methyltransferase domain-containing protein [Candidatus Omnitrophota bacterium]
MRIDIIIAARSGSKGIYRKNTMLVAGRPLIDYTVDAALDVNPAGNIYISTDDGQIKERYRNSGRVRIIDRPKTLADDNASVKDVLLHAAKAAGRDKPSFYILLFPTTPLRTSRDINSALRFSRTIGDFDSVVGVTRLRTSPYGGLTMDKSNRVKYLSKGAGVYYRRQSQPESFRLNGAIFIVRADRLNRLDDMLMSGKSYGYEMDDIASIDIDTPFDVAIAEAAMSFAQERLSPVARGGFNVQRLYIYDDARMGIRRNVFDAAAYERHFRRYKYFLPHIRKTDSVLDIACGSGYGSEILASKAKYVQGVDLDPKTIEYARRHHCGPNVRFDASGAERYRPGKKFDKVISIETIEHLEDPEGFLGCISGWLKPGGQVWLTCPLSDREEQNVESPFHISELTRERLVEAMSRDFKEIRFYDLGGSGIFTVDTLKNKVTYIVAKGIKK